MTIRTNQNRRRGAPTRKVSKPPTTSTCSTISTKSSSRIPRNLHQLERNQKLPEKLAAPIYQGTKTSHEANTTTKAAKIQASTTTTEDDTTTTTKTGTTNEQDGPTTSIDTSINVIYKDIGSPDDSKREGHSPTYYHASQRPGCRLYIRRRLRRNRPPNASEGSPITSID